MQQFVLLRSFMRQPLMIVLGLLTGAGAAKSGHGAWAVGGFVTLVSIHLGAVAILAATRRRPHAVSQSKCL